MELQREIVFRPAFDKRDPDPKKNYGIHGVELCFYLKGKEGAVQFLLYTNWQLPHVAEEFEKKGCEPNYCRFKPMAADIGYHSYIPRYEGQLPMTEKCELLGGKPCYYDGSSLYAEKPFAALTTGGDKALWEFMEAYYRERFLGALNG